jgi:hypothetical protein
MQNHIRLLDTLLEAHALDATIAYDASIFTGSATNPLCTLRFMTLDDDDAIESETCAAITGLPAGTFDSTSKAPDVSAEDLERALGRMTLAWLASVRNRLAEDAGLLGREALAPVAHQLAAMPVRRAA